MNKTFLILLISIYTLISSSLLYISKNKIVGSITEILTESFILNINTKSDLISESVRKNLISGYTRGAELTLNLKKSKNIIDGYQIVKFTENSDYLPPIQNPNYFKIIRPIYFSTHEKTKKWGQLILFFSKERLDSFGLPIKIILDNIFLFIFTMIMILLIISISIYWSFIKSVKIILSQYSQKLSVDNIGRTNSFVWSPLIKVLREAINNHSLLESTLSEKRNTESINKIARQVAHDIRSPLTVLEFAVSNNQSLSSTNANLLKASTQQIKDIANDLLDKYNNEKGSQKKRPSFLILPCILDEMTSQKRIQFNDKNLTISFDIKIEHLDSLSLAIPTEFKRVLSNLVNNSYEAIKSKKEKLIDITLTSDLYFNTVEIFDNGTGIPENIISNIFDEGFSFNKSKGNGIGLHHAKSTIESFGGKIVISNNKTVGSTVTISLPRVKKPQYLLDNLNSIVNKNIVILDDNQSIHELYKNKLEKHVKSLVFFQDSNSLSEWINNKNKYEYNFILDYSLTPGDLNGIEVAKSLKIENHSILISSHYSDTDILNALELLRMNFFPKQMLPLLTFSKKTYIQIDDDSTLRMVWEMKAREKEVILFSYSNSKELFTNLSSIPLDAEIYADYNLGANEDSGETILKKLYNLGYRKLFLSTGYNTVDHLPSYIGITDKFPPFL